MPYKIVKLKSGKVKVVNKQTGQVKAKGTTLTKAKKQIKLLNYLEGK